MTDRISSRAPRVECVACEREFSDCWAYMAHLREKHGYEENAASTMAVNMVSWKLV